MNRNKWPNDSKDPSLMLNNQWILGSGLPFSSYNPANGKMLWQGHAASEEEVSLAVSYAKHAFASWSFLSLEERITYIKHFQIILKEREQEFADLISQETGKPLWDSLSEVSSMLNKIDLSIAAYQERCSNFSRPHSFANSITRFRPHGVVAVLGPYNFPGHLPHGHIVPALLAGNTLIFKPSDYTPLVGQKMVELWQQAELPSGVLNLLQGGKETGQALVHHPDIQGLFFTGSFSTGYSFSQLFGSYPSKILALEMGGNNPLIVGKIKDVQAAAYLTLQSAYITSGQRCTCARRLLLLDNPNHEEFLQVLLQMAQQMRIGPYTDNPEPFMGPVISSTHAEKLLQQQNELISQGGHPLLEMKHLKSGTGFVSPGLMDVSTCTRFYDEEIFGPFLQVLKVNNLQEGIEEANRTSFGLAAGLLSDDEKEYQIFYRHIQAGIVNWNTPLTGASSAAPFGGIKNSGNYRPSAYYAADYCAYPVASLEKDTVKMPHVLSPGIVF